MTETQRDRGRDTNDDPLFWNDVRLEIAIFFWYFQLPHRFRGHALAILRHLARVPEPPGTVEDGIYWHSTGKIVRCLVPATIPHATTCYRLLDRLERGGTVVKRTVRPTAHTTRTFYAVGDFDDPRPNPPSYFDAMGMEPWHREQIELHYKTFVQAESGRRVAIRNGLFAEWVEECRNIASAEETRPNRSIRPPKDDVDRATS